VIRLENITKMYHEGKVERMLFERLNFSISHEKLIAIKGRSGSGKTTLLKIIAGLDHHYEGDYYLGDGLMNKNEMASSKMRLEKIGIITQSYHLLTDRNVYNNIALALVCQKKKSKKEVNAEVIGVLKLLNILHLKDKSPQELSGGEAQRVAIARALVKKPEIILADEPTGALDEETEASMLDVFKSLAAQGRTIIIVTHSDKVASICEKVYTLQNKKMNLIK